MNPFTNRNFAFGTALILIILFTAIEFIVYNEETLLLISFSLFIIVAYRGVNKMIADMWDDTALKIKIELDSFKEIQKETLELLISKQKERKLIATQISEIFSFAKSESEVLVELSKKSIESVTLAQVEEKLRSVQQSEASLSKELFDRSLSIWEEVLISKSSSSSLTEFDESYLIRENINTLYSFSKFSFDKSGTSSKQALEILYLSKITGLPAETIVLALL